MVSVILNFAPAGLLTPAYAGSTSGPTLLYALLVVAQFWDEVKIKETPQLINVISGVLQKMLIYFNGTTMPISLVT